MWNNIDVNNIDIKKLCEKSFLGISKIKYTIKYL
jgi:hypothetical protein